MSPREISHGLDDMLTAIDCIFEETTGKGFEDYKGSWLLKHAIERGIEIVSEASRICRRRSKRCVQKSPKQG